MTGRAEAIRDDVVLVGPSGHAPVRLHLRESLAEPVLDVQGQPEDLPDGRRARRELLRLSRLARRALRVPSLEQLDGPFQSGHRGLLPAGPGGSVEFVPYIAREPARVRSGRSTGSRPRAEGFGHGTTQRTRVPAGRALNEREPP